MIGLLAGMACLALAVGWSRCVLGPGAGSQPRYVTLSAASAAVVFLAWSWAGGRVGRFVCGGMAVAAAVALPLNTWAGWVRGDLHRRAMAAVERDIRDGLPDELLARLHESALMRGRPGELAELLAAMRRARLGPYRRLPADAMPSPFAEMVALPEPAPAAMFPPVAGPRRIVQRFTPGRSGTVRRIDLMGVTAGAAAPSTPLLWLLAEPLPGGGSRTLALGSVTAGELVEGASARLLTGAVPVRAGRPLELTLAGPPELPAAAGVVVVLYGGSADPTATLEMDGVAQPASLRGWLVFE
jgi:hypothetical protein